MHCTKAFFLCFPLLAHGKRWSAKPADKEVYPAVGDDAGIESDPEYAAASFMEQEALMPKMGDYSHWAGASDTAKKFVNPFEELATGDVEQRKSEWTIFDYNGNGHVSLAEMDAYIEKKLKSVYGQEGLLLWKAFRPSYIRAFMDAKDIGTNKKIKGSRSLQTDDYIQRNEFLYALHYICLYALMYDKFAQVDGYGYGGEVGEFSGELIPGSLKPEQYDDRRISLDEWMAGYQAVSDSGFKGLQGIGDAGDAEVAFKEMDTNNGGYVLLSEWCEYLENKEAEAGTEFGELLTKGE